MKDLLDAHMPVEKKDRRRGIIFFLSMFLLLGGGAFLLINKPWIDAPVATESISQQNTTEKNIPSNPRDEIANKPGSDDLLHPLSSYLNLQTAFLAASVWFCLNNIFCNCLLALERFDFEVPVEIPNCSAISS